MRPKAKAKAWDGTNMNWYVKKTDPNEPIAPTGDHTGHTPSTGVTKREYFAAMAMQGFIISDLPLSEKEASERSVKMADDLIKALNGTK